MRNWLLRLVRLPLNWSSYVKNRLSNWRASRTRTRRVRRLLVPPASLEARVNDWVGRRIIREPDEDEANFALRRHSEWSDLVGRAAWGDFADMVRRSRDGVVRDLVLGTRDQHGNDGAEGKRAMIYAFNAVLNMYDDIEKRAAEAQNAIRRFEERRSPR